MTGPEARTRAVLQLIRERRNTPYLKVKPDPIGEDRLRLLLEAANWAPTHRHTEPWRFHVFVGDGRARLAQTLGDVYRQTAGTAFSERKFQKTIARPRHTPAVLAVSMQPPDPPLLPEFEEILAVGCAVQNLWLVAQSLDIGVSWSTPAYIDHPELRAFLGLADNARCFGFLYLGYLEEGCELRSVRQPIEDKLTWIRD